MVKPIGKRGSVGTVSPPVVPPKKADPGLQSLIKYGDNLEEFVAICGHLPAELRDDLRKVATINEETHRLTAELSREQAEILEKVKAKYRQVARPEEIEGLIDEEALERVRAKRRKVEVGVNEKVALTKKMYGSLDACITSIDDEIDRLEQDVKENYGVMPDFASLAPQVAEEAKKNELAAAAAVAAAIAAAGGAAGGAQAQVGVQAAMEAAGLGGAGAGAGGAARRDDPAITNEPVYCVCRQVGWGDMIGCDNEDCEHGEWFHYHCVGLEIVDQKQLVFWLCPGCAADAGEKERRKQMELMRAANNNTAAVKMAAVKLPEDGEGEDEEDDEEGDEEEEDEEAAEAGPGGGVDKKKELLTEKTGGDEKADSERETAVAATREGGSVGSGVKKEEQKETGKTQAGKEGGTDQAPRSETKREEEESPSQEEQGGGAAGTLPKEDVSMWQGFGGLGGNALPDGAAVSGEKAGGCEVEGQGAPGGESAGGDGRAVTVAAGNDAGFEANAVAAAFETNVAVAPVDPIAEEGKAKASSEVEHAGTAAAAVPGIVAVAQSGNSMQVDA